MSLVEASELKNQTKPVEAPPRISPGLAWPAAAPFLLLARRGPALWPWDPAPQAPAHSGRSPCPRPCTCWSPPAPSISSSAHSRQTPLLPPAAWLGPLRAPVRHPAPHIPVSCFAPPQTDGPGMQPAGRCLLGPGWSHCDGAWSTRTVSHDTRRAHGQAVTARRSQAAGSSVHPSARCTQLIAHLHTRRTAIPPCSRPKGGQALHAQGQLRECSTSSSQRLWMLLLFVTAP